MLRCKNCGNLANAFWNDLCSKCNPELQAWIKMRKERKELKRKLYFAMRSRVLTDEEMQMVEDFDYSLLVQENRSYRLAEVQKEFSEALLQQFKIRYIHEKGIKLS